MARSKKFIDMNEDERIEYLDWRSDVMSKHCAQVSLVTKKGGHRVRGEVFLGNRGKRNKKSFT